MVTDRQAEIASSVAALQDLGPGYDQALAEGLVERILLIVDRHPAIPRGRAEHVIGHLDMGVSKRLRGLRPIADLCRVGADITGGKESVEAHVRI